MKVLLLGGNGALGPYVVKALAADHELRITDIKPPPLEIKQEYSNHEFMNVDASSADQVMQAANGMDAILNLAVVRSHRRLAFAVNVQGCYNVMQAAVKHGIRRVINTGPLHTVTGPSYQEFDYEISPDVPPHPGTGLYGITKSLGQEICRAFSEDYDIYVQDYLYYNFRDDHELKRGAGGVPFIISYADAAEVFRIGLAIDLEKLPSRCEDFLVLGENPQGKYLNDKLKHVLDFTPRDDVTMLWRKARD